MIFNMVGGGGAGGASIFIINSVSERPTNVFNNTLWVNTNVDVVKYVFSDNEPSSPTEGMLWLTISDSDNINVAAPINKDWMKFNLGIVRQYISGAWERKLAQLYKDGIWVDVSRLFAAYIDITYPANSNCVVTNSIGQTVASNTNTTSSEKTFTAIVGATGTYTVTATATDGSGKSKSQDVSITSEGQSVSVELTYRYYLFEEGAGAQNGFTVNSADSGLGRITADSIEWNTNNALNNAIWLSPTVNLSNYKTLVFDMQCKDRYSASGDVASRVPVIGVGFNTPSASSFNDSVASKTVTWSTDRAEQAIDVSSLSSSCYVKLFARACTGWIYNIWLE